MVDRTSIIRPIQRAKEYRDNVMGQISGNGESTIFSSVDEARVASRVNDGPADFIIEPKNFTPDAKGNPELEKFESGKRHSFEIPTDAASEVTGQTSTGQTKVAITDRVADKNTNVY